MKTRTLIYDCIRAVPVYPRRTGVVVLAIVLVGVVADLAGAGSQILGVGLLAWAAVTGWWFVRQVVPAQTTDGKMKRRGDREQRAGGVASVWDVMERGSAATVRRQAVRLRPSLADVHHRKVRAEDVGFLLATTGVGWLPGQRLYSTARDATIRVGAPDSGKTVSLACYGLDAPGALITTSTRLDLAKHVHIARRMYEDGSERAVHIFNPTGTDAASSTVRWSILVGCDDFTTAARRAADLIPKSTSVEGERWDRMARTNLPILLHAAAVSDGSMADVLRWVAWMSANSDRDRARRELADILIPRPNGRERINVLDTFLAAPDRGRGSALMMMTTALTWVGDDAARQIGDAPRHTITFNPRDFIVRRETLHILGLSQVGNILAPLTSALVAEIAHHVRMLAQESPGDRVDPFVTALLDEAAVATTLPLDEWSADMGGTGMALHMSVQSLSQLELTWGPAGAATLKGNAGALIVYGGGMDTGPLEEVSVLCGHRWRRVITEDTTVLQRMAGVQRGEWEKVRVLTPAQLSQMPKGEAAILKRGLGGVFVGHPPQVNERRGWVKLPLDAPLPEPSMPVRQRQPQPEAERESA